MGNTPTTEHPQHIHTHNQYSIATNKDKLPGTTTWPEFHWKCFVSTLLLLEPDESGLYVLFGRPIVNVEILGTIVSRYVTHNRTSYTVDDGTGLITCNLWRNEDSLYANFPDLELGQLVNVQGKLNTFRNEKRINITHIRCEEDLDAESLRWLEIVHLTKNYYVKWKESEKEQNVEHTE